MGVQAFLPLPVYVGCDNATTMKSASGALFGIGATWKVSSKEKRHAG
jgi:hypothetical protein